MGVLLCLYVFLMLLLWLLLFCSFVACFFPILVCFLSYYFFDVCLFSNEREEERVLVWIREVQRASRGVGKGKP